MKKNNFGLKGLYQQNGWFYFRTTINGVKRFFALGTKNYMEAYSKALRIKEAQPINYKGSINHAVRSFLSYKISRGRYSRFSVRDKGRFLERFAEYCGANHPLESLKPKVIENFFLDCKKQGLAESTLAGYKSTLQSFFQWCIDERHLFMDGFIKVLKSFYFVTKARKDYLKQEQITHLLRVSPNDDITYVIICGALFGMRKNEIIESRSCWFDFDAGHCHIQNCDAQEAKRKGLDPFRIKNGRERKVPIYGPVVDWLRNFVAGKEYCLASEKRRGKSKYRYNYEIGFKKFLKEQNMGWVSSHTLRHSFATNLACKNISIGYIAEMLGDSIRTTEKHYAQFLPTQSTVNVLDIGFEKPVDQAA